MALKAFLKGLWPPSNGTLQNAYMDLQTIFKTKKQEKRKCGRYRITRITFSKVAESMFFEFALHYMCRTKVGMFLM